MFSFFSKVKDSAQDAYREVKDVLFEVQEASDDLLNTATPLDRWFTPAGGWPKAPSEMPPATAPAGYKLAPWEPPQPLCPTAEQEPWLFDARHERPKIGELFVEVIEAEGLPNSLTQAGAVDPYAVVVFEGAAARTSQVHNDTTPRWGAEAPRAFKFNITCPYSALHIALLDSDQFQSDDKLGRVVIDVSQFFSRTTYDCWWPLQFGMLRRHVSKRGAVRLRLTVVWAADRTRLLNYAGLLPTFIVPFIDTKARRVGGFAVTGTHSNPSKFQWKVFALHLSDLKSAVADLCASIVDFLFWRWPFVSICIFVLWQLLVSFPTMLPACVPMFALTGLIRSYNSLEDAPHVLDTKLTAGDLLRILIAHWKLFTGTDMRNFELPNRAPWQ